MKSKVSSFSNNLILFGKFDTTYFTIFRMHLLVQVKMGLKSSWAEWKTESGTALERQFMKSELEVIDPIMQLSGFEYLDLVFLQNSKVPFTAGPGIDPESFMPPNCKIH